MKYMLLMNVPGGPYQLGAWPEPALKAHFAFLKAFNEDLRSSGEFVAVEALCAPDQAKLVRAGQDPVTDGVFPESKEFLAGFWVVDVDSAERASAIARAASAAPGPAGAPLNLPIEVRRVMSEKADDPLCDR